MSRTATIRIERDVKSVRRDVHALIEIGLMAKDSRGSVLVPFSRIRTEFDLQPKKAA